MIAPESYTLDSALLARQGNAEIQLDLFLDYASNVALYPKFQEYFRKRQPPLLAVWGKNDPFFLPAGAGRLSAMTRTPTSNSLTRDYLRSRRTMRRSRRRSETFSAGGIARRMQPRGSRANSARAVEPDDAECYGIAAAAFLIA